MVRRNTKKGGMLGWILGLAVVVLLVWGLAFGGFQQLAPSAAPTAGETVDTALEAGACINVEDTTLTFSPVDKFNKGTAVQTTNYVSVDGGAYTSGVTTVSPGDVIRVFMENGTNSNFHSAHINGDGIVVPCKGTLTIGTNLEQYDGHYEDANTGTLALRNEDNNKVNDGGGATNVSGKGVGATYNLKLVLDGENEASTNDMLVVLESSSKSAIKDMVLTGAGAKESSRPVPQDFITLGANSEAWVYEVDPIVGAVTETMNLQVISEDNGNANSTSIRVTYYTFEDFLDVDGTVQYGVENSDRTLQSMTNYTISQAFFS